MAKKEKASETKITRISASDSTSAKQSKKQATAKAKKVTITSPSPTDEKRGFIRGFFGYFSGAWYELKQVRWPTRGATWSLTAAVLGFSAFFVIFILLLDAGFKYLFEQLLK